MRLVTGDIWLFGEAHTAVAFDETRIIALDDDALKLRQIAANDPDRLLADATEALQQAKKSGRDRIVIR